MKLTLFSALGVCAIVCCGGSSASASVAIDGVISPGEYTGAIVTNTPYNPLSDTTLHTFSNGNENVAETTYFQNDPNGTGFDFAVQTDPVGPPADRSDRSLNDQFTNVYFGNATSGAQVVFELANMDAVNLATNQKYTYSSALGILYADTPGTAQNMGNKPSVSEAFIPYAAYNTVLLNLGITPVLAGDPIQVRDLQAFSYGGNNAGGGNRFGTISVPSVAAAVPEPSTWACMLLGLGFIATILRRKQAGWASQSQRT